MAAVSYTSNEIPSPYLDPQGPTTSAVYTDLLDHPERRSLSICLDIPPSSSPFPSPSSSFLPPPILGNHEFAMRLLPSGNSKRRGSLAGGANGTLNVNENAKRGLNGEEEEVKTMVRAEPRKELVSSSKTPKESLSTSPSESQAAPIPPKTALPSSAPTPAPASTPQTPTIDSTIPTPPATPTPSFPLVTAATSPNTIPSHIPSSSMGTSTPNNAPTSNRSAPPSPAASRRLSSMSAFSTRSRTPAASTTASRANSIRRSSRTSTNMNQFATAVQVQSSVPPIIHVRDFAFDKTDERFRGAGALAPRANRLSVLSRKLAGFSDDEDDEADGSECDGEDIDAAWDRLRHGWSSIQGFNGWGTSARNESHQEVYSTCEGAGGDTRYEDEEGNGDGEEEPLYPGLYRAMYAFDSEGTAEMALVEDQVVRVIGRGGGVGWAVVVDESAGMDEDGEPRLALVPEGYLEVVKLDLEDEEA